MGLIGKGTITNCTIAYLSNFVEVDVHICEPGFGVLAQRDARHLDAGEGDHEGRVQQRHVRPQGVVDDAPGHLQDGLVHAEVLAVVNKWTVRLEDDQTAVHVLQEVKFAFQDMIRPKIIIANSECNIAYWIFYSHLYGKSWFI